MKPYAYKGHRIVRITADSAKYSRFTLIFAAYRGGQIRAKAYTRRECEQAVDKLAGAA